MRTKAEYETERVRLRMGRLLATLAEIEVEPFTLKDYRVARGIVCGYIPDTYTPKRELALGIEAGLIEEVSALTYREKRT